MDAVLRGNRVVTWSAIYLATSWLPVLAEILNPNGDVFMASDLLYFLIVPGGLVAFILTWRWVRLVVLTAKSIDAAGIGYRHGWAFWGWMTPIASLWIPRRLIERSHKVFLEKLGRSSTLQFSFWWGLFVASSILDNISFRLSISGTGGILIIDFASAVLMSIAFPHWKKIVLEVSQLEQDIQGFQAFPTNPN